MFKSVYKGNYIQVSDENTRVIDTSEIVARRIASLAPRIIGEPENFAGEGQAEEYENGYSDETLAKLVNDENSSFEQGLNAPKINTESVMAECQELINQANEEAGDIIENAKAEAEGIFEEAKRSGYEAGFAEAVKNLEAEYRAKQQALADRETELEQQYNELLLKAEPKMAEAVIAAFEHVFGASLYDNRDVMCTLINRALFDADDSAMITVHVSSQDYDMIAENRESFIPSGEFAVEPEIRRHDDYAAGTVKIETAGGIIDCSIDTEFQELKKAILLLAGER